VSFFSAGVVVANSGSTFDRLRQFYWLSTNNQTEFDMNELTPAEFDRQWQEAKQQYTEVGIELTPEQEQIVRQAYLQLATDLERLLFENNSMLTIGLLFVASVLPQQLGSNIMMATGLSERLGNPLLTFRNSVLNALTPAQQQIWEERIWNGSRQTRSSDEPLAIEATIDPVESARQWAAWQQRFIDAGLPLTPEQESQMQSAFAQLQADLMQEFQANPGETVARLVAVAILPAPITERLASSLVNPAIVEYGRSTSEILTPAQQQVWGRGLGDRS
jgi:hypothetical protein